MGNDYVGMNYRDNTYRYRQDSSFLYFFGIDQANMCAVIDLDEGKEIVFGDELSVDYIVWMGPQKSIRDKAAEVGVSDTRPRDEATSYIQNVLKQGRKIHVLPPYRDANAIYLAKVLDTKLDGVSEYVSTSLSTR